MSIYRFCGDSLRGRSHEKNDTVCQDSLFCLEGSGFVVAAVADGLGSSKHSDIASKIAAKSAVEYCINNVNTKMHDDDILNTIKIAFDNTNFTIKQTAGDALDDYDTTLSLAVFIQGSLFYGHAGDSGIIALRKDGFFDEVTKPQLGEGEGKERPVYPLAAQSKWVFEKYPHPVHAIFLMTDGMLNKVIPPLLEDQIYKFDNVYLFYLYDNLRKNTNLSKWISDELTHIQPQEVNYDDITIVAIMCKGVKVKLRKSAYYKFPGETLWNSLLEGHKNKLYAYKTNDTHFKTTPQADAQALVHSSLYSNNERKSRHKSNILYKIAALSLLLIAIALIVLGSIDVLKYYDIL